MPQTLMDIAVKTLNKVTTLQFVKKYDYSI